MIESAQGVAQKRCLGGHPENVHITRCWDDRVASRVVRGHCGLVDDYGGAIAGAREMQRQLGAEAAGPDEGPAEAFT